MWWWIKIINSSPPSAVNMRQRIGSALVQIMACHLFGAKPLCKPVLGYCQLDLPLFAKLLDRMSSYTKSLFWKLQVMDQAHEHFSWNCSQLNATGHLWKESTSLHLSQCWLRFVSAYAVTSLKWVNVQENVIKLHIFDVLPSGRCGGE